MSGTEHIGSGLYVGTGSDGSARILTANHVARSSALSVELRGQKLRASVLVTSGTDLIDLAVLSVSGLPPLGMLPVALLGQDRNSVIRSCTAVGFPEFKVGAGRMRRSAHVEGEIPMLDGLLETGSEGLQPGHAAFKMVVYPSDELTKKPWSGMSGAVIADEHGQVIGVIRHHNELEGAATLGFTPLSAIDQLSTDRQARFWDALGVSDPKALAVIPQTEPYKSSQEVMLEHRLATYRNRNRGREAFINSEASSISEAYFANNWRTDQQSKIEKLRHYSSSINELESFVQKAGEIPWNGTYETIRDAFTRFDFQKMASTFGRLLQEASRKDGTDRTRMDLYANARRIARLLHSECYDPKYGALLAIMGSWGAGKSRLIHEIEASSSLDQERLILNLTPTHSTELEVDVLTKANAMLDVDFGRIADLAEHLETRLHKYLVIILDDFHTAAEANSNLLQAFEQVVAECTLFPSIRWIVTADVSHFDSIVHRHQEKFWLQYAYQPSENAGVGWLDLDANNLRHRVGFGVLHSVHDDHLDAQLREVERDSSLFDQGLQLLCNPLPAWLCLERTGPRSRSLDVGLNHQDFVRAYWDACMASLTRLPTEQDAIRRVFGLLVRRTAEQPSQLRVSEEEIFTYVREHARLPELSQPSDVKHFLGLLVDAGLLSRLSKGVDEDGIEQFDMHPSIAPVWADHISRTLTKRESTTAAPGALGTILLQWGQLASDGDWLAEAVCEFYLEFLPWDNDAEAKSRRIWTEWAGSPNLAKPPLLLAAIWAPAAAQSALAALMRSGQLRLASKREVFALLRLVGLASSEQWRCHQRLYALAPYYSVLGEEGLGDYFAYMAAQVISAPQLVTRREYASVLLSLFDVDHVGDTRPIVRSLVETGDRLFNESVIIWLLELLKFFRKEGEAGTRRVLKHSDEGDLGNQTRIGREHRRVESFSKQLGHAVVAKIVTDHGLLAVDMFLDAGWYAADRKSNLRPAIALRLQTDANVEVGKLFKPHSTELAKAYISVIKDLVDGKKKGRRGEVRYSRGEQRLIAFFLIRHSRPTNGDQAVSVDERLRPMLATVADDPDVQKYASKWLPGMCRANGIRFAPHGNWRLESPDRGDGSSSRGGRRRRN
ncbi:serine protease [Arthrobacter sp. OAP107]|uniref:S1 family peptidase n=1 Tax=Arthrobacter sp. OAP107 TaxID=3156445 RepID=UPI00339AD247